MTTDDAATNMTTVSTEHEGTIFSPIRRVFCVLALIGACILSTCSITNDTPYETQQKCVRDRGCAQRFNDWFDCRQRYDTGC